MVETIIDSFSDVIKVFPLFFVLILIADLLVYQAGKKELPQKLAKYGPFGGGLLGLIPQCGISVAFARLYSNGYITLGMLLTVFLSTSDEALIIIAAHPDKFTVVLVVLLIKLLVAVSTGSLLNVLVKEKRNRIRGCGLDCSCPRCRKDKSFILHSFIHAVKITVFLFLTVFLINMGLNKLGEENFYSLLGKYDFRQPVLASLIGMIPSCFSSVFIAEAYIKGAVGFGSLVAGLCANTGYGILVIFKEIPFSKALKIVFLLLSVSILAGEIIVAFGG